jgi:hypothetical protein
MAPTEITVRYEDHGNTYIKCVDKIKQLYMLQQVPHVVVTGLQRLIQIKMEYIFKFRGVWDFSNKYFFFIS